VPRGEALRHADAVLDGADPAALLDAVDEVWTMTSLLGFEALLRGIPVTVTGAPFYAGWGLTRDLGAVPARRRARPDLLHLAHAVLIAYPRYLDPLSGRACPPEVVVERLIRGGLPRENRVLARLQGLLASRAHLWR
jgi:capsular polysaccharide export protein